MDKCTLEPLEPLWPGFIFTMDLKEDGPNHQVNLMFGDIPCKIRVFATDDKDQVVVRVEHPDNKSYVSQADETIGKKE